MKISPSVGFVSPAMHLMTVVFPQPDGPRRTMNSPDLISRENFSSAVTLPYLLVRSFTRSVVKITSYCSEKYFHFNGILIFFQNFIDNSLHFLT